MEYKNLNELETQLKSKLFANLNELQHGVADESVSAMLKIELSLLYDILGEKIDEEYWEQIELLI